MRGILVSRCLVTAPEKSLRTFLPSHCYDRNILNILSHLKLKCVTNILMTDCFQIDCLTVPICHWLNKQTVTLSPNSRQWFNQLGCLNKQSNVSNQPTNSLLIVSMNYALMKEAILTLKKIVIF